MTSPDTQQSPMDAAMGRTPDPLNPVIPEPDIAQVQAAQAVEEPVWGDYFGFEENGEFTFPDGRSKIFFRAMNEGDRARYQRETTRDVTLARQTGDARVKTDPAGERYALIMASVTGWNLKRRDPVTRQYVDVPFGKEGRGSTLSQWVMSAQPKLVDQLEEAIRKVNPWLIADMNLEDINREIERLEELKQEKLKAEAEKDAFRA